MFFWPEVVWILSPSLWPQSHWACKHMTGYPWLMEIYLEHFFSINVWPQHSGPISCGCFWWISKGTTYSSRSFLCDWTQLWRPICIWSFASSIDDILMCVFQSIEPLFFPTNGSNAPALFGSNFGEFPCTNHLRRIYSKHCVPTYYPCTTHVLQSRTIR